VTGTLDSARQSADASEYDRALARCERAIATAEEARAIAREDAPDRVPDAEAALDDATALRETIQAERDARKRTTDGLDTAEGALDDATAALDGGSPEAALETLDGVAESLDTARASIADHEFTALAERVATLDQRQERLRQVAREARTRVPAEIPGVTRHSLSYADIEKHGELGQGGNVDVFRATARTDGGDIDIALKEPRMSGGETLHTETVERMMDEAETWQRLDDHDHIVSVLGYGSEPLPWIGMEYMDAGHLGERAGDLPFKQALWTAIATTRAVRHAHDRGVAHLDLKPANILFRSVEDAWDTPKVADWGLSKHLLEHSNSVEGMSPQYAAPEQFDTDQYGPTDNVTDVYRRSKATAPGLDPGVSSPTGRGVLRSVHRPTAVRGADLRAHQQDSIRATRAAERGCGRARGARRGVADSAGDRESRPLRACAVPARRPTDSV
jgi:hypothetical protein